MNVKKKITAMAMVGALSFGFGGCYVDFAPTSNNYTMAATVGTKTSEDLAFITDETNSILSRADIEALSNEQASIHQKGDVAVDYEFYTYIYSSDSVKAKDKAKEVADKYVKKGNKVPIIFVLNKADKSYHFIEDNRLAPYTAAAYISSLAEKTFTKEVSADTVKEFVIRVDSTLMMSVDGDFSFTGQMPINEQASAKYVTLQNFADSQEIGKHTPKAPNKENNIEEEKEELSSNTEEDSGIIPALLALIFAIATIILFKIRERK